MMRTEASTQEIALLSEEVHPSSTTNGTSVIKSLHLNTREEPWREDFTKSL